MFTFRFLVAIAALTLTVLGQPAAAQDLKERLAAVKQSVAANQQALRSYTWLEKTELSLKGEVKATKVDSCRYGPDGRVPRTPVVQPPPPDSGLIQVVKNARTAATPGPPSSMLPSEGDWQRQQETLIVGAGMSGKENRT